MAMASITVVAAQHVVDLPLDSSGSQSFNHLSTDLPGGKTILKGGDEIALTKKGGNVKISASLYKHINNNSAAMNSSGGSSNVTNISYEYTEKNTLSVKLPEDTPYYLVTGSLGNNYFSSTGNSSYTFFDNKIYVIGIQTNATYDPNGGSGGAFSVFTNGDITVADNEFSREGYDFVGWSTNKSATKAEYVEGDVIKPTDNVLKSQFSVDVKKTTPSSSNNNVSFYITPHNTADITLYAIWKKIGSSSEESGSSEIVNPNPEVKAPEASSSEASSEKAETIDSSLKNPKSIKLTAGKKSITVSWKKLTKKQQKQIAGIEIQYSTDKSFKENVKTVNVGKAKSSKKISKLTPKKKYYVKIRVYKKNGAEKAYSNWSSPKNKKVK